MISEKMMELGKKRSVIREIFEFGNKRRAEIGAENVYDFSLGNPSIPAPDFVNETMRKLVSEMDSVALHGYTSAQGAPAVRKAISDHINSRFNRININIESVYIIIINYVIFCIVDGLITNAFFRVKIIFRNVVVDSPIINKDCISFQ